MLLAVADIMQLIALTLVRMQRVFTCSFVYFEGPARVSPPDGYIQ